MKSELSNEDRELIRASNELAYNWEAANLSNEAHSPVALIPTDNPELAANNLKDAEMLERKTGQRVLLISASRERPGEPYTIFSTLQSAQQMKPV